MRKLPSYCLVETNFRGPAVVAFIGSKGAIGIDTPIAAPDADTWRRKIKEKCRGMAFVVQMDSSPDRSFAASHLLPLYGTEMPSLLVFQQAGETIKGMQDSMKNSPLIAAMEASNYGLDPMSVRWPRPSIVFPKELTFYWDDALIVLQHAPSIAPGSCWVHLPDEDLLMVGDSVAVTLPPLLHEARFEAWLTTLSALRKAPYKNCRILCAHGGWVDPEQVNGFMHFLQAAQKKLAGVRDNAAPQKEIHQAAKGLMEYFHVPADRRDFAQLRLQTGLQAVWDREHSPSGDTKPSSG
jgi:hypothetical protein